MKYLIASLVLLPRFCLVAAQAANGTANITEVGSPSVVDLATQNFRNMSKFSWKIDRNGWDVDLNVLNVDLLSGPQEAGNSEVVDVVLYNSTDLNYDWNIDYCFPTTMPVGQYHIRVNATMGFANFSDPFAPEKTAAVLVAHGPTINVVSSLNSSGCGVAATPGSWKNVSSPTSSDYTSFVIYDPQPGSNVTVTTNETFTVPSVLVNFKWRNNANLDVIVHTISDLQVQLQFANGTNFGLPKTFSTMDASFWIDLRDVNDTVHLGQYKLQATYKDSLQDGSVSPGGLVTYTTDVFNVVSADGVCSGTADSNGTHPDSGNGSGSGGSGGGGSKNSDWRNTPHSMIIAAASLIIAFFV